MKDRGQDSEARAAYHAIETGTAAAVTVQPDSVEARASRGPAPGMDLDRFKEVNDACGHAAGDELLREISLLLQRKLREGDTLARLGGDEFGVLLENCAPDHAVRIAEALRDAVAQVAFECHGRSFTLGVSVGLVPIAAGPHSEADILNAADASCYRAKAFGRGRVHIGEVTDKPDEVRR